MRKTALIVDDSVSMRSIVSFTLSEAGYEVIEGSDGVEGLAKLKGASVQIIISDVNMPNMDGIAFVKRVRALPEHRFTPILMLTTESLAAKKMAGKEAGATGWLVKPFNPAQMLQAVAKVLE